jgi:2,5-furandicarboxylate decarboxylase 1
MSLREYLNEKDAEGSLIRIKEELSTEYEVPAIIKKYDRDAPILFENVEDSKHSVVANVCNSRNTLCKSLNIAHDKLYEHLYKALENPKPCKIIDDPISRNKLSLDKLPVLTHYKGEQGPYITAGLVYAKNPTGEGGNVSYHRIDVLSPDRASISIQPGHLKEYIKEAKESNISQFDISISIGNHPATMIAAALRPPKNVSEYSVANTLLDNKLDLIKCPNVDALAPAHSEIIIEAKLMLQQTAVEGPYICVTGTMKETKKMPVIQVVDVITREDYIYQGLLGGGNEHRLLESIPNEVKLWRRITNIGYMVRGINMTPNGSSWLHGVISYNKKTENDSEKILEAAIEEVPALKHMVLVDTDIDPYNLDEVEWALATRFQGDRDLIKKPDTYASRLDPSSDLENKRGCKLCFDATIPIEEEREKYMRGIIPVSEKVKKI